MTYLGFHLRFTLPALALLAWPAGPAFLAPGSLVAAGWVLLAVFVFTVPWDNVAAARGLWGFPRERYTLRIGYLPVEEYAFFAIQSLMAMGLTRVVCDRMPDLTSIDPAPDPARAGVPLLALLGAWLAARRLFAPARELETIMARLLGHTTREEIVALAAISAIAEEVAFRGALQHAVGWVGAAAIFALLHIGPRAPFLLWSGFALGGGLAFGWAMELRQALLGPIVGHLLVNLVQLRRLADLRGDDTAGLFPDE